jgi:hypothetical protein
LSGIHIRALFDERLQSIGVLALGRVCSIRTYASGVANATEGHANRQNQDQSPAMPFSKLHEFTPYTSDRKPVLSPTLS